MPSEAIVIASDHAGYELKEVLKQELTTMGYQVLDLGTGSTESVDYPDFGRAAAEAIAERLALKKTQIAAWLSRGIAEERVRKLTRPVRYAVTHRPDPQASFLRDRE